MFSAPLMVLIIFQLNNLQFLCFVDSLGPVFHSEFCVYMVSMPFDSS